MRSLAWDEGREEGGSMQAGWNQRPHDEQSHMHPTHRLVQQFTHLDNEKGIRGEKGCEGVGLWWDADYISKYIMKILYMCACVLLLPLLVRVVVVGVEQHGGLLLLPLVLTALLLLLHLVPRLAFGRRLVLLVQQCPPLLLVLHLLDRGLSEVDPFGQRVLAPLVHHEVAAAAAGVLPH